MSRPAERRDAPRWWQRLLWFVALWSAGVLAVGALGALIRFALHG